jgi:hypothetical protein
MGPYQPYRFMNRALIDEIKCIRCPAIRRQAVVEGIRRRSCDRAAENVDSLCPGVSVTDSPPLGCISVAQNKRSPPGQQNAITTGEGNRLRNPFHTQPAVAARKHGEVAKSVGEIFLSEGVTFSSV